MVQDKLILCSFTEGGGRNWLNSKKIQTWVGCSGNTWWEIGAHKGDLHKWKKEEIIHRARRDLRSYWCAISCKLWESNPFFCLYFCFLCNSSSSKGFRADFPGVTKTDSKIWKKKFNWENCFFPLYLSQQTKVWSWLIQYRPSKLIPHLGRNPVYKFWFIFPILKKKSL